MIILPQACSKAGHHRPDWAGPAFGSVPLVQDKL